MGKKILIIGSGGREHAFVRKLADSPREPDIYVAPGNGGTQEIAENILTPATDIDRLLRFAESHAIDLTVVGSEGRHRFIEDYLERFFGEWRGEA